VGQPARQEGAQVGAGRARASRTCRSDLPQHACWCRNVDRWCCWALISAAPTSGAEPRLTTTSTSTRSSSARRRCTARPDTRWASSVTARSVYGDPNRDTAVLAFFGDGASARRRQRVLRVGGGRNLPIVYFCQNKPVGRFSAPSPRRAGCHSRGSSGSLPGHPNRRQRALPHWPSPQALDRPVAGQGPTLMRHSPIG